jgi:hypothetical protein
VVGAGENFFGDAESGADFSARELTVFEELEVGGREFGLNDFGGAPEDNGFIGGALLQLHAGTDLPGTDAMVHEDGERCRLGSRRYKRLGSLRYDLPAAAK